VKTRPMGWNGGMMGLFDPLRTASAYISRMLRLRSAKLALLSFCPFLVAAGPIDSLGAGRRLAADVLSSDSQRVLRETDPAFISKVGGRQKLLKLINKIRRTAGEELGVDYERVFRVGNEILYDNVGSFSKLGHGWLEVGFSLQGARLTSVRIDPEHKKPSAFIDYTARTKLRLPFGQPPPGTAWFVLWAGDKSADNYHARRETHFAIDFLPRPLPGTYQERSVRTSPCWGLPILAAADGIVSIMRDGMKDQPKLFAPNAAGGPGNYVVIDHGNGEFALYGHLRKGSIRVRQGQRVSAGEPIGLCGNSGASEIPHLHFQLQTAADIDSADGLPPMFDDYFSPVRHVDHGSLQRGEYVLPGSMPSNR